ncbi:hypothetical protein Ade02nite_62800 [Paractinoplanes deccanensis]|uniref:Uncharacterized protein n=1 Tax=Paractinoplanes deccanensis TaxID=113561 RepID=A0ABQ3YCD8_9ACTN|nr:hypothetical protein [Actinoplanes deccanensis]GID77639.1 hypothetical protein Ade02nite_62800 [Actinoplanes deccanensis]
MTPEQMEWALAEAGKEALAVAPGWFRAWPTADEKWSAVNIRSATQVIVNRSREDDRHPNSWTVRALFGNHAVELRVGPYDVKDHAVLVAHAVLSVAYRDGLSRTPGPPAPPGAAESA